MTLSSNLEIEWIAQDSDTLAHTSALKMDGKKIISPLQAASSPHHSLTRKEFERQMSGGTSYSPLIIAGENLKYATLVGVGHNKSTTDQLTQRLKDKMIADKINLVYPRIPLTCTNEKGVKCQPPQIDDLRASGIVDVQLEANAHAIIPPIPSGIERLDVFERIFKRTLSEVQTFGAPKEIIGYIPITEKLKLVGDMIKTYVKNDCHFFAVDFSGAPNQPSLMRTTVRTIRESMKISNRAKESTEKYYLHVFDIATNRKSSLDVTSISDLIIHPYGVDSTSSQMWGGGNTSAENLRYYLIDDYGAYRKKGIKEHGITCSCPVCKGRNTEQIYSGGASIVLNRLKEHRVHSYAKEYRRIAEKIETVDSGKGYQPYLFTKNRATNEIESILRDVNEIKAGLS